MTDEPRIRYLNALKNLKAAEAAMQEFLSKLRRLESAINAWETILLPDEAVPFFPPAFTHSPPKVLAAEWPSFEELSRLLLVWRQARRETNDAWRNIPRDQEQGLEAPPEYPSRRR
ncbi:MAG: hypothetical protein ABSD31_17605 [Candidatus Binataceae bacterium]